MKTHIMNGIKIETRKVLFSHCCQMSYLICEIQITQNCELS